MCQKERMPCNSLWKPFSRIQLCMTSHLITTFNNKSKIKPFVRIRRLKFQINVLCSPFLRLVFKKSNINLGEKQTNSHYKMGINWMGPFFRRNGSISSKVYENVSEIPKLLKNPINTVSHLLKPFLIVCENAFTTVNSNLFYTTCQVWKIVSVNENWSNRTHQHPWTYTPDIDLHMFQVYTHQVFSSERDHLRTYFEITVPSSSQSRSLTSNYISHRSPGQLKLTLITHKPQFHTWS